MGCIWDTKTREIHGIHGFYQGKLWFNHVEPRKMWVLHGIYQGDWGV